MRCCDCRHCDRHHWLVGSSDWCEIYGKDMDTGVSFRCEHFEAKE